MKKTYYLMGLIIILLLAVCGCGKRAGKTKGENAKMSEENQMEAGQDGANTPETDADNHFVPENPANMPETDGGDHFVPENPAAMPDASETPTPAGSLYEQAAASDWYPALLKKAQMNLGNNRRLKAVIDKARAGEKITIATIGGSITEGAGAKKYNECYAYQFYEKFCKEYAKEGADNIAFVNAGVGGTPSPFGLMRYDREIVSRVEDADGLPEIVVIEFSVNDYQEPTNHHCFESMVKQILSAPNDPVVILLFAVFPNGFNLQKELAPIGRAYDLMMVSILDGAFPYVGDKWTTDEFFFDIYHPTSLGHMVMADCMIETVKAAERKETDAEDIDLNIAPVYGTDFVGLKTIYKTDYDPNIHLEFGGFSLDDKQAYQNYPIGRVCGENFYHTAQSGSEPLTFETSCKNLLISYRAVNDSSFGNIDVYVDGKKVRTLKGNTGSWGQSVQDLIFADETSAVHKIEIRMAEGDEDKKFTITCIGYTP